MPVASILLSVGDDQASICGATLCARTTNGVPRRTLSVPMAALHQAAACIGAASALLYDWTTLDPTIMHSVRIFEWLSSASVAGTCIARLTSARHCCRRRDCRVTAHSARCTTPAL